MNREEERNYVFAQLSSLPNAFQYVSVTNYIENLERENKKYKEVIDKAIEELKKGLHELDTRRREDVYVEEYIEESIDILEEEE